MFQTSGLNHITLFVADLQTSLSFYTDILRMNIVHRGDEYAYLEAGSTWFCISEQPRDPLVPHQRGVDHIALTVRDEDFETAVQHLRDHNVPIVRGPILRGLGKTVNFLDPDGVQWEFHGSNLAERMTVIHEMERQKQPNTRTFDLYAFADYSGSTSPALQRKHIVLATGNGRAGEETTEHHTRDSLLLAVQDLLHQATHEGQRVLFGFDHNYSFPLGFYETITGESWTSWDQLLALLEKGTRDLPPLQENARTWAEAANRVLVERLQVERLQHQPQAPDTTPITSGPFWGSHFAQLKDPHFPFASTPLHQRRLTEERDRRMKPIYQIGGAGAAGLQSLYGIRYLSLLRRYCHTHSIPLFCWPFDGWDIPDEGHVLVEVYPTLYNQGPRTDEEDALACVRWFAEEDRAGRLSDWFSPTLTANERRRVSLEGWVLGVK